MAPPRSEACVHELIEQRALVTPAATAVFSRDERVTFMELNRRANRLAHRLVARGVGPEVPVGIDCKPSPRAVVAALAVLKAGGAYVALSRDDPPARRDRLLERGGIRHVVCDGPLPSSTASVDCLMVDDAGDDRGAAELGNLTRRVGPDNAAFVRFTSGSTGEPKAVVNTHRGLAGRLLHGPLPDIIPSDRCAVRGSYGSRLFYPLALGAPIVLLDRDEARDPAQLARAIACHQVTSVYLVPTLLRRLLQLPEHLLDDLQCLRAVAVGGDVLGPAVIARFFEALPQTSLIGLYGSTEIGTTAAVRRFDPSHSAGWRELGDPVAHTAMYILDQRLSPAPEGVVGEICVASPYLARGYLGDTELTARRFIRDASFVNGGRVYRTGDLGRSRNGRIEFLGRADDQVKLRGFRVELGDVEAALLTHSSVVGAAAATISIDGEDELVGYVVCAGPDRPAPSDLRDHARRALPTFMVPRFFVLVDELPVTAAGKIDRKALPPVDLLCTADCDSRRENRAATLEQRVASIWCRLFKIECVLADDSFMALGGDSLMAMRMIAALQEELGIDVPIAAIFESTPATLSALLASPAHAAPVV